MYATTLIAIVMLHVGFLLFFPATWLVWKGLAPSWVDESQRAVSKRPFLTGLLGLLVGGLWFVVGVGLSATGIAPLMALGFVANGFLLLYSMAGVAAFAGHIGSNLPSPADTDRPWKSILRGGIALELTWILPVIGWFVLLPLSVAVGVGAATQGIFRLLMGRGTQAPAETPMRPIEAPASYVEEQAPAAALHA